MSERYLKQIVVMRRDMSMPVGKVAAMAAHAAVTFLAKCLRMDTSCENDEFVEAEGTLTVDQWRWLTELDHGIESTGQISMAKIVVSVANEAELLAVEAKAQAANLTVHRVIDSGYSHNKCGDFPCIAIGPHWPEQLDPVTGGLKIYR